MADTSYTYAVARVRAKEVFLFSDSMIQQLIACKNYESCLTFLREHGWGSGYREETAEEMLSYERQMTWSEMKELVSDKKIFSVLTIPNEFHNLKTAIKQVCSGDSAKHAYYDDCEFEPEELKKMVGKREFQALPAYMAKAAAEATEALLQTGDGQLCDIIIDRATLKAVKEAGEKSNSNLIREYAESFVAVADIRIAVRSSKTGKSAEFMERSMAPCDTLNLNALIKSAASGTKTVCGYLEKAGYKEASDSIKKSSSAFEIWCDNRIIETIKSQKYNSFSEGPLISYILARENEIKTVRIVLTGKYNKLGDDFIRERVRNMYA